MEVSQSDCMIQGSAQNRGTSSNSVQRRALTCGIDQSDAYATVDILPDDVLLEIFDFHRIDRYFWEWVKLVHVCQRWRQVIFDSPLRLGIHLRCTDKIDVKKLLGCWPAFPITVSYSRGKGIDPEDEDNLLAALEHSDRVHHINLHIQEKQLAKLGTVIQEPFPMLTQLQLTRKSWPQLVLPHGFLGGSAPRLQELKLEAVVFPELPKFLLSTRDLVTLHLSGISLEEDYIAPETMVTYLASLTRLTSLHFYQDTFPYDQLDLAPLPQTRTVLPALTSIVFDCVIRYVDDLVARIDCPRLNSFDLYSCDSAFESIDSQISQIYKFINRSEDPLLTRFDGIDVDFGYEGICLRASHNHPPYIAIFILLDGLNWRLSHVFQFFSQFSPMLSNVRHLSVDFLSTLDRTPTDLDWAQLLVAFSALQTVDLSGDYKRIAPALEYIDKEMAAGLLPALDLLYIQDWPMSSVDKFCTTLQDSGRVVTVVKTHEEFYERQESYL